MLEGCIFEKVFFLHFIFFNLLITDNKKSLEDIIKKDEMIFYITRIMINQQYSKTSRYYYKYKKYYKHHVTGIKDAITADNAEKTISKKEDIENKLKWVEKKLKKIHWFNAEVFRLYYKENFSLNEMSKATKINKNTLYKAIKNVKNYLKDENKKRNNR